ncbi:hypothetical protein AAVH_29468 [Aphelenchoides avenae]|nr:hypothetical protein AAVH_29468 [Aphelenchus avenae]
MCSLINRLCVLLHCTPFQLGDHLRDTNNLTTVYLFLASSVFATTHLKKRNRIVTFKGLSLKGPNKQHAYGGYLGVTVEQHMYCRHRVTLRYPDMPCIEEHTRKGHVNYYPVECLQLYRDQHDLDLGLAGDSDYYGSTTGAVVDETQTKAHSWRKRGKRRSWKRTPVL